MPDPTQARSDAIRAALIAHVGQDLRSSQAGSSAVPRATVSAAAGTATPAFHRRRRFAGWAAGVAVVLIGTVTAAAIVTALNTGNDTAAPIASAQPSEPTRPLEPSTDGDTATWQLLNPEAVTADSSVLELAVTRLGCANGVTGEVLAPRITYEAERILIEVDVEAQGEGAFTCLGNDAVPIIAELIEPIGERSLIDRACLEGEATTTAFCVTPTRWP